MRLPSNNLNLIGLRATGAVTVRHVAGQFEANFENEFYEAQFGTGAGVETAQPVLIARTIDVESLAKDIPLQIGDREYVFKKHEPDGTGMSRVLLKR